MKKDIRYYYLGIKEPKDKSDMKSEVKAEIKATE